MKKKKYHFIRRNIIVIIIFLMLMIYFSVNMYEALNKLAELKAIQQEKHEIIQGLEQDIVMLNDELEYIQTPEAIEAIARERLKMVKPNEIIYIIRGKSDENNNN